MAGKRSGGASSSSSSSSSNKKAKVSKPASKPNAAKKQEEDDEAYWAAMEEAAANNSGDSDDEEGGSSDDDDSDSESSDDGEIKLNDELVTHNSEDYTFEFNDMKELYSEGICTLLSNRYLANGTKAYSLAETITAQSIVGTAIVCEGGDDVFGFATVLPLRREEQLSALYTTLVNPLVAYLGEDNNNTGDVQRKELALDCLTGSKKAQTGALLHKRFANLPIELVGHLHRNLDEDLGWAKSNDGSDDGSGDASSAGEHLDFKEMTYLLLLASCELTGGTGAEADVAKPAAAASKGKGKNGKGGAASSSSSSSGKVRDVTGTSSIIFDYFEDDIYFEEASAAYYYKPAGHTTTGIAAMVLPLASFKTCVNKIMKLVPKK